MEKEMNTSFVDKAIIFATNAHAGRERRNKNFPYIIHPLEVLSIVATMTNDQDVLAAAVLHDTVEDTSVTTKDLRELFNSRVAAIVSNESDKSGPLDHEIDWKDRKIAAIERLKNSDKESKIVALGDKLSNMRAIYRDYLEQGDKLFEMFRVKDKQTHSWRYHALVEALRDLDSFEAFKELEKLVNFVFPLEK